MSDDIIMAQVEAGEAAVVERLRQKGLLPAPEEADCYCVCHSPWSSRPVCEHCKGNDEVAYRRNVQRQQLQSTLATTFIAQQKERDPAERTRLWNRCLELAKELEQLNEPQR